jgi:antitoxin component HigA of HigAB toxin-antitoxin module
MATSAKHRKAESLLRNLDELVRLMPPMAIRDDVAHENSVEMIDRLMQVPRLSKDQSNYLETLVELVEAFEAKRHAIDVSNLSGLQMLKHALSECNLCGSDLARLLTVHLTMGSKILGGERRLTWDHAKILGERFKVEPAMFMD